MNKTLKFITHSSIFISLCAAVLSFYYTLITDTELNLNRNTIIFFATLLSYIGVQLIPLSKNKIHGHRGQWILEHKLILTFLMVTAIFAIFFNVTHLTTFELLNFSHLFIIVLFYEKIFLKERELRKIPYLKPFLIAYVWTCSCTAPQLVESGQSPDFFIWLECFLFILGLTIPFDIRDIKNDYLDGVTTFATKLSIKKVKMICVIIFTTSILLQFNYLKLTISHISITLIIFTIYLILLSQALPNQKEHYFLIGFDGIILLKLLYLL